MNHVQLVIDSLVGTTCKDTEIFDKYDSLDLEYRYTEDYERVSEIEYYTQVIYLEPATGISYTIDVYHNTETGMVGITSADMFIE